MSNCFKHINLFIIALAALCLTTACSEDELFSDIQGKETVVTFRPTVANSLPCTRAVSEGKAGETLSVTVDGGTKSAWYVSTNYVFVPKGSPAISATIDLQTLKGESLKQIPIESVTLTENNRTNVVGQIVVEPVTISEWDGKTRTEPKTTTTDDGVEGYLIEDAANLAWMAENPIGG